MGLPGAGVQGSVNRRNGGHRRDGLARRADPFIRIERRPDRDFTGGDEAEGVIHARPNPGHTADGPGRGEAAVLGIGHDGDEIGVGAERAVVVNARPFVPAAGGKRGRIARNARHHGDAELQALAMKHLVRAGHQAAVQVAIGGGNVLEIKLNSPPVLGHTLLRERAEHALLGGGGVEETIHELDIESSVNHQRHQRDVILSGQTSEGGGHGATDFAIGGNGQYLGRENASLAGVSLKIGDGIGAADGVHQHACMLGASHGGKKQQTARSDQILQKARHFFPFGAYREHMKSWLLAARTLARRPAYLVTALIVLALGIGATAALFSVVSTVLLAPLPYPGANRLALVLELNPAKHENLLAPGRLAEWDQTNQSFVAGEGIVGEYAESETDTSGREPERLAGERVSPGFFRLFGTAPELGRIFTAEEQNANGPGAAVISDRFWRERYGRNPDVLKQQLVLGGARYAIVGVMPASFGDEHLDVWLPAQIPPSLMRVREARFYTGIGRLRAGVSLEQAQADLDRVEAQLGRHYPATDGGWSAEVTSLKDAEVGSSRAALWAVFGAVVLLLLLAVANLAGLTLAQLQNRERELAVRSALGASRGQLLGTVMREMVLLAAAGAALGGLLGWFGVRAIAALAPGTLPRMSELHFSLWGWLFAAVVSALATVGFGLAPAWAATRSSLRGGLDAAGNRTAGGQRRAQHVLVAGQLALTVLLLAGAGLLLRTYRNLAGVEGGFSTRNVVTFHVSASWNEDRAALGAMQQRLLDKLRALPGVVAAGFTNFLPASNATLQYALQIEGLTGPSKDGTFSVGERSISPGYLQALQVPIVAGSGCPAMPAMSNTIQPAKALVNRSFVDTYLRGGSIIGRQFKLLADGPHVPWSTIIGVTGDVRENSLGTAATPFLYICLPAGGWPDPDYVVRSAGGGVGGMGEAIRGAVEGAAPGRAVFGLQPLATTVASSIEQPRLDSFGLSLFAGFALLLAAVGLYSLISLLVAGRKRELAVRMALGETPAGAARLVLASTGRLLLWGSLAGLVCTWAASRLLATLLFGVAPMDPITLTGAIVLVVLIALLATWLPAQRAAATDPARALRE